MGPLIFAEHLANLVVHNFLDALKGLLVPSILPTGCLGSLPNFLARWIFELINQQELIIGSLASGIQKAWTTSGFKGPE